MSKWLLSIDLGDVFHNGEMTFQERRDSIVARLRESAWFRDDKESDVAALVEELSDVKYRK